jgi:hypothetical protein
MQHCTRISAFAKAVPLYFWAAVVASLADVKIKGLLNRPYMAITTLNGTRTEREREVENALASVRMEGLEISTEAQAIFGHYVDGDLSSEELDRAFDQYFDGKYGPVRLPRNECP